MVDKEMLEAMRQMMQEELRPINGRLDSLEKGQEELRQGQEDLRQKQEELRQGQETIKKDVRILKHDVKEIGWKVDTLYDWVDGIDLKVKKIDDRTA